MCTLAHTLRKNKKKFPPAAAAAAVARAYVVPNVMLRSQPESRTDAHTASSPTHFL